tara:strand:- start:439 stop:987 length:549 start_codon:yes stop_codon:yes gene_type:complete
MALGTLKCTTIEDDATPANSITVADLVSLDDDKADLASPTFTGTVTLPANQALTGTPTAPTAAASTDSTQIATTAYVKDQVGETAVITAQRSMTERTITASAFDLSTGNLWTCGAIAIPNPDNGVAGQVGVIRVTAAPTSFGDEWDHPGGSYTAPTSFPALAPFFVISDTQFLLGSWTEGVA